MCGLSGYIRNETFGDDIIRRMAGSLNHRGPDHTAFFTDDRICLAHNRLKIIDLSDSANQPFHSSDNRYVMIYNGEVYNFREIASELGLSLKTRSDTEVILEAYLRLGDEFIHKLNGMFAIAIYDKKQGSLKLWRDRMGIKPLYYFWDGKIFAFASELKALLQLPLSREPDPEAINDYLFLEYIPQPKTAFRNFFKLGNGTRLTFSGGKMRLDTYYDLTDRLEDGPPISENEALERFNELFTSSLRDRMISDVPIGAFLSGGVDSSSVCAGLSELTDRLSTFHIGFDDAAYDESPFAAQVAGQLKTNHTTYRLRSSDLLESKDLLFHQFDEPFAVSSIFPTYKVSQLARQKITVALSGDGGDELFMGYGHYPWYKRLSGPNGLNVPMLRKSLSALLRMMPSRYARISKLLEFRSLAHDWPHIWSQEQYMFTEAEISALTGQAYRNTALRESWKKIAAVSRDAFQSISLFDIKHYLADDLLYKVDIASMANGLEVRLPFLDHRLVEFTVNLSTRLKFRNGESKYLLKKYLAPRLAPQLIHRRKRGFGAPVDQWMTSDLRPLIDEMLSPSALKKSSLFDPSEVLALRNRFDKGNHYEFKRIWALVMFQVWFENHGKPVRN